MGREGEKGMEKASRMPHSPIRGAGNDTGSDLVINH